MIIELLAFGKIKNIVGGSSINIEVNNTLNVEGLKNLLEEKFPELKRLTSYMVAVNNEYALLNDSIQPNDEVAIIPPVSGG